MSITLRTLKSGKTVYEIRISRGRDPITGKQLTPYTKRFDPPANCPSAKAMRLALKEESKFEAEIAAGMIETKQEKKARILQECRMAEEQRKNDERKPTVSQYVKRYLENKRMSCKPNTIRQYWVWLKQFVEMYGDAKLEDVSAGMISRYMDMLRDRGLKSKTVHENSVCLRVMFREAKLDGLIDDDPTDKCRLPKCSYTYEDMSKKVFSEDELKQIFAALESQSLCEQAIVYTLAETGCRIGEVLALKWENIDVDTGDVLICGNLQKTDGNRWYITTPKSGQMRYVYLMNDSKALQLIKELKETSTSPFVFSTDEGEFVTQYQTRRLFDRLKAITGIQDIHAHKFRHTLVTTALKSGVDIATVSAMAGHSNPSITLKTYAHTSENTKREGFASASEAIKSIST